jgi:tripartite-type tricarboxylate transporter receptor subunit TctC
MTQVRALSLRWISATAVAWFLVTSAIAAAATASTPTANPESEVASAFEGKTFAILVGFPPGGPHDLEARVFARHLRKYLPGQPRVLVQNMPGAGGMIMFSHLYSRAKPDGLTVGIFPPGAFTRQILQEDTKFDMGKMPIVWAVSAAGATIVRDFLKARTARDLLRVDPSQIVLAARSAEDSASVVGGLELELLGIKGYKHVHGYAGDASIKAAMERGEASFFHTSDGVLVGAGIFADMTTNGLVVPLWQSGVITREGKIVRSSVLPQTPTLYEVLQEIQGKPPSGVMWEAYEAASVKLTMLRRIWFLPPGTPQGRVDALRRAINRMADDTAFAADWERVYGQELAPRRVPADVAERLTHELLKPAPWQGVLKKLFVKK